MEYIRKDIIIKNLVSTCEDFKNNIDMDQMLIDKLISICHGISEWIKNSPSDNFFTTEDFEFILSQYNYVVKEYNILSDEYTYIRTEYEALLTEYQNMKKTIDHYEKLFGEKIKNLQIATTAYWITPDNRTFTCSNCHGGYMSKMANFCPDCGAKMKTNRLRIQKQTNINGAM